MDYASIDSITHCLKYGAINRFDIFNSGVFDTCPDPVVCNGKEVGNYIISTELLFDDVCREISVFAFNPRKCGNSSDPPFLSLNFKTWGNKNTAIKQRNLKNIFLNQEDFYVKQMQNMLFKEEDIYQMV